VKVTFIQSVTETLVKNTDNVNTLREASEVGHSGLQEVATDIREIARESEGLLEINSVMENLRWNGNIDLTSNHSPIPIPGSLHI
jgi:methyl-accepting chemotaxis protein